MQRLINERRLKARKKYRCDFSGIEINEGDLYWRSFYVGEDGEPQEWNTCLLARGLIEHLDMFQRSTDGTLSDDEYRDFLVEYISDHDLWDQYYAYDEPEISQFVLEAILSHSLARTWFGARESVVKEVRVMNGSPYDIEFLDYRSIEKHWHCPECDHEVGWAPRVCSKCGTVVVPREEEE